MTNNDKKKYNRMENMLQIINKNFVSVSDEDVKKANPLLKHVMDTIIKAMKRKSPLFENLYESVLYGGSFYDGLKVGKPEEFDIDLKLVLPKALKTKLALSNQPGFVTVQMPGWATFEKSNEFAKFKKRGHVNRLRDRFMLIINDDVNEIKHFSRREYRVARELAKFKDETNHLLVSKVLQWMESTVNMALNDIGKVGNRAQIPYKGKYAQVALKKSGPAVTALIEYDGLHMDVDLVAVFKLSDDLWPPSPFRPLPNACKKKKEFLIVPKIPKAEVDKKDRCWRMSFQEQEKMIILGINTCKPVLRLIKKLRDTQNHNMISSYFIKTVFLHEIEKHDKEFWNAPLAYIFMHMLKTYRDYLSSYNIPYYWNKRNNLLKYIDKTTIDNFKNFLSRVIDTVDRDITDNPYIIGSYLLNPEELKQVMQLQNIIINKKGNL